MEITQTTELSQSALQADFKVHEYTASDGKVLRYAKITNPKRHNTGKALLFIPGLGGSVKGALPFLSLLMETYSPIYSPDLRSFGLNPIPTPLKESSILVNDLKSFYHDVLNGETQDVRVDICGISLGGVLATLLTADNQHAFERLTLLAPAYKAHAKSFPLSYQVKNIIGRLTYGDKHKTQLPYGIEALTRNPRYLNDPQYRDAEKYDLSIDFLMSVKTLNETAFNRVRNITTPTLMVVPGADIVCDPSAMKAGFHRLPEMTPKRLATYPNAYHDILFEEEVTDVAKEMIDFAGEL